MSLEDLRILAARYDVPIQAGDGAATSPKRFPDGAHYRFEIPSTEGPRALEAVLAEAHKRGVVVERVSQGSGIFLMTDDEILEMAAQGREAGIEVNLFIGPRATFDIGAQVFALAGKTLGLSLRGSEQIVHALADVERAIRLGIRSILVSDIGLLKLLGDMRRQGDLPANLVLKTSVMMAPSNALSARILEDFGAGTINIPSDLTIPQIAAIRSVLRVPIDFYVEAPDNLGGFIRHYEIPELIRVASPIYLKFGLRNAPDIYPSGSHLEATAIALSRERVRRAQLATGIIAEHAPWATRSGPGAHDLGIPALAETARR
jgi:hypothetical protein